MAKQPRSHKFVPPAKPNFQPGRVESFCRNYKTNVTTLAKELGNCVSALFDYLVQYGKTTEIAIPKTLPDFDSSTKQSGIAVLTELDSKLGDYVENYLNILLEYSQEEFCREFNDVPWFNPSDYDTLNKTVLCVACIAEIVGQRGKFSTVFDMSSHAQVSHAYHLLSKDFQILTVSIESALESS